MNQLALVSGILFGFVINFELARLGTDNWRWMFAVGALPAVAYAHRCFGFQRARAGSCNTASGSGPAPYCGKSRQESGSRAHPTR